MTRLEEKLREKSKLFPRDLDLIINELRSMLKRIVEKYPIISYSIIAFSITWGIKLLYAFVKQKYGMPLFNFGLIASYGPSISALLMVGITLGKRGLNQTLNKITDYKVGIGWLTLATFFEFIVFMSITLTCWVWGKESLLKSAISFSEIINFFVTLIGGLFFWGLSEEIGWRGWALPKLQSKLSPFWASIVLALIASFWHINPNTISDYFLQKEGVYLYGYYSDIVERIIISIPFTLVITYIFNNTRGSLLVAMLFHSGSNTAYFWIDGVFGVVKDDLFKKSFLVALIIVFILFSILVIKQKKKEIL